MSKLSEFLKLLPDGLKNIDKILHGIYNDVNLKNLPKDQQEEIAKRRAICASCPYSSSNAKHSPEFIEIHGKPYETSRTDEHCTMCGCPLNIRTAALDKNCGIEKYNESHQNKLPLKWEKYEG